MERMPVLRTRVPRDKVRIRWLGAQGTQQMSREVTEFQQHLQEEQQDLIEVGNA
jgi:hypothetical protein